MNEQEIQKQVEALVKAAMSGNKEAAQLIEQIMQAAQIVPYIQNALQSAQQQSAQQVSYSKNGSKLDYIRQLRGGCPEGYEVEYFANGGGMSKRCKCSEKKQDGGEMNAVDAFKCGRKMKKVKKAENGGDKFEVIKTPTEDFRMYRGNGDYEGAIVTLDKKGNVTDSIPGNFDGSNPELVKKYWNTINKVNKVKQINKKK